MERHRRTGDRLAIVGVLVVGLSSCATIRVIEPRNLATHRLSREGQPIVGYVGQDSVVHRFEGYVQERGDSLVFLKPVWPHGIAASRSEVAFELDRGEVLAIRAAFPNRARSLFGIAVGVGILGGLAVWVWLLNSDRKTVF